MSKKKTAKKTTKKTATRHHKKRARSPRGRARARRNSQAAVPAPGADTQVLKDLAGKPVPNFEPSTLTIQRR